MKTLSVNTSSGKVTINLPTKLTEVTPEWLESVTEGINPAPYYSLIAIVFKDNLSMLLNTKRRDNKFVAGVPVFVKTYNTPTVKMSSVEANYVNDIKCGTPIVMAPSDIAMGNHIVAPNNSISPAKIVSLVNLDTTLRNKVWVDAENIYPVEFKIVPNSSIHGAIIETNKAFTDPFIVKSSNED